MCFRSEKKKIRALHKISEIVRASSFIFHLGGKRSIPTHEIEIF